MMTPMGALHGTAVLPATSFSLDPLWMARCDHGPFEEGCPRRGVERP